MPAILERCVQEVMDKGHSQESAFAICQAAIGGNTEMTEADMRAGVLSEMTKREFGSYPVVKKRIPLCEAIGEFLNGDQEGALTLSLFRKLVDNFTKHPRQVPVYLIVGDANPEHPEDLDARLADGWIEGLSIEGNYLMGDLKANGPAAIAVIRDAVRGASIGTVQGKTYDGHSIGQVLEHVVLTNSPFVKGMNIAARSKGGERVAFHFTAFEEAPVADDKKKADPAAEADKKKADEKDIREELEAANLLLTEQTKKIKELTESNEDLDRELRERQKNSDLNLAIEENRTLKRQVEAGKIRELVSLGIDRGQFKRSDVVGYDGGDDRSDALTLKWFKNSMFEGEMGKLTFALKTFPKTEMRRSFVSGEPIADGASPYTAEEEAQIKAMGKDPKVLAAGRGAKNLTEWKRRTAAVKG